jgi:hypothetical protein
LLNLQATKATLSSAFPVKFAGPAFDFASSAVSTFLCSVISTPQMVLTDRIMAGYYPNLVFGVKQVFRESGVRGLYAGWFAALAQKIPSYGLTWVFFQQLKEARTRLLDHEATHGENFAMGAMAAACTVSRLRWERKVYGLEMGGDGGGVSAPSGLEYPLARFD